MALTAYPWLEKSAATLVAQRDRLPNAFLIYGPRGIGLFELGRAVIRALMCTQPLPDGQACGRCRSCELMQAQTHPDVQYVLSEQMCVRYDVPYVEPEGSSSRSTLSGDIRIHQIRALTDFLSLASNQGGRRFVMLYPVNRILPEAANALLKSIEEPPADLTYILVAEDIDAVLPTIRSRSRLVRVEAPDWQTSLDYLKQHTKLSNPEVALAKVGGAPMEALQPSEDVALTDAQETLFLKVLRAPQGQSLDDLVRAWPKDKNPPRLAPLLLLMARWVHDLIRVKMQLGPRYYIEEAATMATLTQRISCERLIELDRLIMEWRRFANHPLNARITIEAALLTYRQWLGGAKSVK